MKVSDFTLTRFQFARDRVIGDSQVRADCCHVVTLELHADGLTGLGFGLTLFHPLPDLAELERVFREEVWPRLEGAHPASLIHRVSRPRGGNNRGYSLPFAEAVNQALWDLAAQEVGLPLWKYLGGTDSSVPAYASGLDFHLTEDEYVRFFRHAKALGFSAFKIKVGHPELDWDLRRLELLRQAVGPGATVMVDANEAWTAKEALRRLDAYRRAGFEIFWVEDPCIRDDFAALREIRRGAPWVHVNSGEYLDIHGKRQLLEAEGADLLNVHGMFGDVMRIGWLAADHGIPVTLGNTMLELGVHLATALPECDWLEYSFQNYNHLVAEPFVIRDGRIHAPDRPGHGLTLSDAARRTAVPKVLRRDELPPPPLLSPHWADA